MNKKTILLLVVLSLLALPVAAPAAEFTLGGYIKMETIWDTTQVNKNLLQWIARNNNATFQHGRLKFTAENTRMWFLIKGPKLWGATTTGYIEWDFDNHSNEYVMTGTPGGGWASPHKARLGIRHMFFRLNWPETELLMGQYWSILTEEIPETANFGACTTAGQPFNRQPQICLTQKFLGAWTASVALAEPTNGLWGLAIDTTQWNAANPYMGESSETPKVDARIKFEQDLWGKAAYWGKPRPFAARLAASYWRTRYQRFAAVNMNTWGQNNYAAVAVSQRDQQYLNNWIIEGSLFIPVIPTYSNNLAGTASLLTQWFVGSGLDAYFEDFPNSSTYYLMQPDGTYDRTNMTRYGGYVQAQYYFTNEWYMNFVWGMNKAFGVTQDFQPGTNNYKFGTLGDPMKFNQHYYLALWYRPIQAFKFGLEYTYIRTQYMQRTTVQTTTTDFGENHRIMFCGFFFF